MIKKTIILAALLFVSLPLYAETLFSDHFEQGEDLSFVHNQPASVTSEVVGSWTSLWCDGVTASGINTTAGHTGRGVYWTWHDGTGGAAMEGDLFINEGVVSATYPDSLWVGFWFKPTVVGQGGGSNDILKMLRFRMSGNSCIPEYYTTSGQWNMYYYDTETGDEINHPIDTADTAVDDTEWHYYMVRIRGASTSTGTDGILEFYVDGTRFYNETSVDWGGTSRNIISWVIMQGNLSGGYTGGAFSTYWDDFIVATTQAEVETFLGIADTTAPTVTISTSDPQTVYASSVDITWSDSDNVGVTTRKWRIGSAPDAENGTEATSPATITGLSAGANTVYIGAMDAAGNWGSDSITVNYSAPAQIIGGSCPGCIITGN